MSFRCLVIKTLFVRFLCEPNRPFFYAEVKYFVSHTQLNLFPLIINLFLSRSTPSSFSFSSSSSFFFFSFLFLLLLLVLLVLVLLLLLFVSPLHLIRSHYLSALLVLLAHQPLLFLMTIRVNSFPSFPFSSFGPPPLVQLLCQGHVPLFL